MAEYVSKETLQEKLNRKKAGPANKRYTEGWNDAILMVKSMIHSEKAADVAPVRHGRWIGCNGEIVDWDENNPGCPRHSCFCSICKSWLTASDEFPVIAYFCPNCGAKMDGGNDD